ncbi:MAG: DUF4831 family protein [Tannerella sp.]|jgi:hypothetical protein|nr:DUF4831 family protein [Tannerella sp.]
MKYIFPVMVALCIPALLMSQTQVEKKIATKASGYGVTYSLPVTSLIINVEVIKETCKAGPYYKYAEKYLGVKNAVTEDAVSYAPGKVTLENKGIPDTNNTYTVEFKAGTVAPYVYLTEDGLLCSINAEYTLPAAPPVDNSAVTSPRDDATGNVMAVFTEELLKAGSQARQAEVAAKQIYHIRESKMDILTGDADNLPPDGEAMKIVISQLENQENALTSLFTGTRTTETSYYDIRIIPQEDLENEVLFRFSTKLGVLDADDLGGEPVYMNLRATEKAPELTPKEAEKKGKMKGIVYNVPGKAAVEIKTAQHMLFKGEVQIVQFGTYELLAPVMFEDKKKPVKVYFYSETGALKQIIQ